MRNSSNGLIIGVLFVMFVGLLSLFLCQSAWLTVISYMLKSSQSAGLPVSSTQVTGFSLPTTGPPAPVGAERIAGNLAITVTRVIRPADAVVKNAGNYTIPDADEEYLMVDIRVRCRSSSETCHLTEFDFGVESSSGRDYAAQFASSFSGLRGLFEGGEIDPGDSMSGALVFIIHENDTGLRLVYPRRFGFGTSAEFLLGQ